MGVNVGDPNHNLQERNPGDEVEDSAVFSPDSELVEPGHRNRLHNGNPKLHAVLSSTGLGPHIGESMLFSDVGKAHDSVVRQEVMSVAEWVGDVDSDSEDGAVPSISLCPDAHFSQEVGQAFRVAVKEGILHERARGRTADLHSFGCGVVNDSSVCQRRCERESVSGHDIFLDLLAVIKQFAFSKRRGSVLKSRRHGCRFKKTGLIGNDFRVGFKIVEGSHASQRGASILLGCKLVQTSPQTPAAM
jgi:hypothetical protein